MRRLAGLGVLAALVAGGALAQSTAAPTRPAPLQGAASNAPIDITAEETEVFQPQRLVIYRGNVEAIQEQTRMRSPELKVYYKERQGAGAKQPAAGGEPAPGQLDRIEASGPFYYVTPTQTAKSDHALYLADPDTITLTGNVILTQDKNVTTGDKLVINRRTGESKLSVNSSGDAHHRVRAIIYPNQNQTPGQAGGKPAPTRQPARGAARP